MMWTSRTKSGIRTKLRSLSLHYTFWGTGPICNKRLRYREMWSPYSFLDGLVLDNIRWSRSERKSCFPTFRTSSTFSRDRNKHGRINCLSVHATNEGKHSSINHITKAERKHPLKKLIDCLLFISRDLTQEEGWKTQDGIMTKKKSRETVHSGFERHFFVILSSCVFQPSSRVRSLASREDEDDVRDIGNHDPRSVPPHPILSNANLLDGSVFNFSVVKISLQSIVCIWRCVTRFYTFLWAE